MYTYIHSHIYVHTHIYKMYMNIKYTMYISPSSKVLRSQASAGIFRFLFGDSRWESGGHSLQPLQGKQWWHETYICAQLSWISNAIQACQPTENYSRSQLQPGAQFQGPAGYVPSLGTCISADQTKCSLWLPRTGNIQLFGGPLQKCFVSLWFSHHKRGSRPVLSTCLTP